MAHAAGDPNAQRAVPPRRAQRVLEYARPSAVFGAFRRTTGKPGQGVSGCSVSGLSLRARSGTGVAAESPGCRQEQGAGLALRKNGELWLRRFAGELAGRLPWLPRVGVHLPRPSLHPPSRTALCARPSRVRLLERACRPLWTVWEAMRTKAGSCRSNGRERGSFRHRDFDLGGAAPGAGECVETPVRQGSHGTALATPDEALFLGREACAQRILRSVPWFRNGHTAVRHCVSRRRPTSRDRDMVAAAGGNAASFSGGFPS